MSCKCFAEGCDKPASKHYFAENKTFKTSFCQRCDDAGTCFLCAEPDKRGTHHVFSGSPPGGVRLCQECWSVQCCVCKSPWFNPNTNAIVMCESDGCTWAVHQACADPVIERVPVGAWYCTPCQAKRGVTATASGTKRSTLSASTSTATATTTRAPAAADGEEAPAAPENGPPPKRRRPAAPDGAEESRQVATRGDDGGVPHDPLQVLATAAGCAGSPDHECDVEGMLEQVVNAYKDVLAEQHRLRSMTEQRDMHIILQDSRIKQLENQLQGVQRQVRDCTRPDRRSD